MRLQAARGTALFIDAAYTLVHPVKPVAEVYAEAATELGHACSSEHVAAVLPTLMGEAKSLRQRDPTWRAYWTRVVTEATGCSDPRLLERLYRYYARPSAWRVAPGAMECCEAARSRHMKVGVISNWDLRLRALLAAMGVLQWIDEVFISAELGFEKPDPRIFQRACDTFECAPSQCVHVGDSLRADIEGARSFGCEAWHFGGPDGVSFAEVTRRLCLRDELVHTIA